jgi:hypothetical protein
MEEFFGKNHETYGNTKSGLGVLARFAFGGINCFTWVRGFVSGWFGAKIN